jgi:hypothetical protein
MIESGRWPGLEQGIDEAEEELGEVEPDPADLEAGEEDDGQQQREPRQQQRQRAADAAPRTLYVPATS